MAKMSNVSFFRNVQKKIEIVNFITTQFKTGAENAMLSEDSLINDIIKQR